MEATTAVAAPSQVYRISWIAYIKPIALALLCWLIAIGSFSKNSIVLAGFWTLVVLIFLTYRILMIRSVQLYTDSDGVWVFKGIFPWNRGVRGVKWRDLEDAVYFPNLLSWLLQSYTVRVGHRFTKSSEIVLHNIAKGNQAAFQINDEHKIAIQRMVDH
ncbi:MAG: hypothetical protein ACOVSV_05965 [Fimbriimonadaceae bacterium]